MTTLPLLTVSRAKAARSCLRYHKLRYLDGYRPAREPDTTRFGTLIHHGLEAWWLAPTPDERLDRALAAVDAAGEADPFELAKAEVLLAGYDTRWGDQDYEVLGVEVEFLGPLINPITGSESKTWLRAGKIDAIVRERAAGRVLVVEHKTSSEDIRQGSEYWRRLRMDGQVTGYFEGARFLGYDVAGCLYDVVLKPAQRPSTTVPVLDAAGVKIVRDASGQRVRTKDGKKWRETADSEKSYVLQVRDETPEEYGARLGELVAGDVGAYFQRGEVARLETEMREGLLDDWHLAQSLREAIRLDRAPRNPDACVRYGRTCEFFDACTGAASLDDQARFTRTDDIHPELEQLGTPEREQSTQGATA